MSKGLEELKEIELKWQYGVFTFIPNFEIIKKELKALEIIKKNSAGIVWKTECSKEDIDFVKEVLL